MRPDDTISRSPASPVAPFMAALLSSTMLTLRMTPACRRRRRCAALAARRSTRSTRGSSPSPCQWVGWRAAGGTRHDAEREGRVALPAAVERHGGEAPAGGAREERVPLHALTNLRGRRAHQQRQRGGPDSVVLRRRQRQHRQRRSGTRGELAAAQRAEPARQHRHADMQRDEAAACGCSRPAAGPEAGGGPVLEHNKLRAASGRLASRVRARGGAQPSRQLPQADAPVAAGRAARTAASFP